MTRPTIAISMGDPAGIGPEVIMKALAKPETRAICNALVIGDANRLRKAGKIVGGRLEIAALREADDADFDSGSVMRRFEPRAGRLAVWQDVCNCGRGSLSLYRKSRSGRAGRIRTGHLYRAAFQGGVACGWA
jgi:hypothetical protein